MTLYVCKDIIIFSVAIYINVNNYNILYYLHINCTNTIIFCDAEDDYIIILQSNIIM